MSGPDLENELKTLIEKYYKRRKTYMIVYAAIGKPIPSVPLEQSDFYVFCDLLSNISSNKIERKSGVWSPHLTLNWSV